MYVCMYVCITYVRGPQVMTSIDGGGDAEWKSCFNVGDVDLPTGYYFGFSAATGDLAGMFILYYSGLSLIRIPKLKLSYFKVH